MFAINRDIFIRNTALLFAFAFFTAQGARGGDIVLAGNAILINLILVAAYFLDGFGTAAEQMCGQSIGARDAKGFRAAVRITAFWSFAFAAGLAAVALISGKPFIDFLTTEPQVRAYARDYLLFAALAPLAGALAYELDGVFVGATWTRDMRNMMLVSLALYIASFYLLRPFGNAGLWLSLAPFSSCARPHPSMALSKIVRVEFSAGPIRRRGAGCVREPGIGVLREETDESALDFVRKRKPLEHKGRVELHETCARLDLGEGGFRAVDAANADQRKLIFHAQIGGREHLC